MIAPKNVFALFANQAGVLSGPESATHVISDEQDDEHEERDEFPTSPTMLVSGGAADADAATPTALPAPPLVPSLAGDHGFRPPASSSVVAFRPLVVASRQLPRTPARAPERKSQETGAGRPSGPPTMPPPGGGGMRRAA